MPPATDLEAPTSPEESRRARLERRLRVWVGGLRTRTLLRSIAVLALATLASILVARQALVARIDERLDQALSQEVAELRGIADGVDPATGEPFGGRVERIFRVYLQQNVPTRGEAFLTFVDGEPSLRSAPVVPYRLDQDQELVERWSALETTERGRVETPAGPVEFLAVPLQADDQTRGVFVVAFFRDFETGEIRDLTIALGAVGLVVVLIGSIVAWRGAAKVIEPVREVTQTARSISAGDLDRRIPVTGDAEVAELARTFNGMLDRLEMAFTTQRMFLDDAGHELRTPITIVRGHLELLETDPEEREATLALVMDELERMGRMVDDLLTLAKVQRPDFLQIEAIEVGPFTDELAAKATGLGRRDWVVSARADGAIDADRHRLTQAVMQLVENAVAHTSEGTPIELASEIEDGEATFLVRDAGPGIPIEQQTRIFERFGRGANDRAREGSGLGLAIVSAIADSHGGRVELESRLGEGATFRVIVPVRAHESGRLE